MLQAYYGDLIKIQPSDIKNNNSFDQTVKVIQNLTQLSPFVLIYIFL